MSVVRRNGNKGKKMAASGMSSPRVREYARARKAQVTRNRVFAILAAAVALLTVWVLMRPAVALTGGQPGQAEEGGSDAVMTLANDEGDAASGDGGDDGGDGANGAEPGEGGDDSGDEANGAQTSFFTLTYDGKTITFNVVDEDGEPLLGSYTSIEAKGATKYVFESASEKGDKEKGAVEEGIVPTIEGYSYASAKLGSTTIASVATSGYINCDGAVFSSTFQFYETEPMTSGQWYSRNDNCTVTLTYKKNVSIVPGITPSGTVVNLFDYWVFKQIGDKDYTREVLDMGINSDHNLKFTANGPGENGENANKYTGKNGGVFAGIVNPTLNGGYPTLTSKNIFKTSLDGDLVSGENESLDYLFDPTVESIYRCPYRNVGGLFQIDSEGYYYYDSTKNYAEYDEGSNSFTLYDDWAVYDSSTAKDGVGNGQFFPFDPFESVSHSTDVQSGWTDENNFEGQLNHFIGMTMTTRFAQQYDGYTDSSNRTPMKFEFSGDDDVWIFIDDVLVADLGGNHDAASVSIDFSTGNVKVNGGGGSLPEVSGPVRSYTTTIKDMFERAEKGDDVSWKDSTFDNDTYHTLKFFYLERGSSASNLKLKSNLNDYPPTSIYKVDQYGEKVPGATFAVYAADEDYCVLDNLYGDVVKLENKTGYDLNESSPDYGSIMSGEDVLAKALYVGTTNNEGEMVFVDENQVPYTITELQRKFGDHFVLREIAVPEGYRMVSDDVHLRIFNKKALLCENTYTSGAYSDATLQTVAPNVLKLAVDPSNMSAGKEETLVGLSPDEYNKTDNTINYLVDGKGSLATNGTLFAVVLKYTGATVKDEDGNVYVAVKDAEGKLVRAENGDLDKALKNKVNWAPVWGNSADGFTVENDDATKDFTAAAIMAAARYTESQNIFALSSGGQMRSQINGMPGDITKYYYMLPDTAKNQTQYTVAYYWSSGVAGEQGSITGWENVNSNNTFLVDSNSANGFLFARAFGATVQVPNLVNRLVAQKLDPDGSLVNGASFALYQVEEVAKDGEGSGGSDDSSGSTVYYVAYDADGSKVLVYLCPDDGSEKDNGVANDNKGNAQIRGSDNQGTYAVNGATGEIAVTIGTGSSPQRLTITPKTYAYDEINGTGGRPVGVTTASKIIGESGTTFFTNMDDGCYYLREIAAPDGYALNATEVMVLVDDTAVYANAGAKNDGVTVARGPGYVVSTLDQFASHGEIDNTLSCVYQQMLVSDSGLGFSGMEAAVESGIPEVEEGKWGYLKTYTGSGYTANTETTIEEKEALSTHLVYESSVRERTENALFNYAVNKDWYRDKTNNPENDNYTDPDSVARRLYTNVGWSYYLLYQDYDWGSSHSVDGANYTDLRDQEISNLFSRSTFVQVTDKYSSSSLVISKELVNNSSVDLSNDEFTFDVTLAPVCDDDRGILAGGHTYRVVGSDESGNEVVQESGVLKVESNNDGGYSATVSKDDEGASTILQVASYGDEGDEGNAVVLQVTLKNGQELRLGGFESEDKVEYEVSERVPANYSASAVRDKSRPNAAESASYGHKEYASGELVEGTLHYNVNTVDFTNEYPVTMHVQKVDSENVNKMLDGAKFAIYSDYPNDVPSSRVHLEKVGNDSCVYRVVEGEENQGKDSNVLTLGLATISGLKNGEYYFVEQTAPSGYKLMAGVIKVKFEDGKITDAWIQDKGEFVLHEDMISANKLTISIPNESGYELPSTGGAGIGDFTVVGGVLVAAALVVGGILVARRRVRGV